MENQPAQMELFGCWELFEDWHYGRVNTLSEAGQTEQAARFNEDKAAHWEGWRAASEDRGSRALEALDAECLFTKGPWHVRTLDGSKWSIDAAGDNTVAQAQQVMPLALDRRQVERTSNTHLMAASPELLAELLAARRTIEALMAGEADPEQCQRQLERSVMVIAKAKGLLPLEAPADE